MKVIPSSIPDVLMIKPKIFTDPRGMFFELYKIDQLSEIGLNFGKFVQDNCSVSSDSVLRGLHFQINEPQGKLVWVAHGSLFDVAVDLRKDSKYFGQWVGLELSHTEPALIWIPPGFAHGFLTQSPNTTVMYKCTNLYYPQYERTLRWDDTLLNITWPNSSQQLVISDKDKAGLSLQDLILRNEVYSG